MSTLQSPGRGAWPVLALAATLLAVAGWVRFDSVSKEAREAEGAAAEARRDADQLRAQREELKRRTDRQEKELREERYRADQARASEAKARAERDARDAEVRAARGHLLRLKGQIDEALNGLGGQP